MTDKECALPCNFENCDGCAWRMTDAEAVDVLEKWNKCRHIDKVCTVDCGDCEYNTTAEQVEAALARAVERLKSNGWISVEDRLPDWADEYLVWWAPMDKAELFRYEPHRKQFGFWHDESGYVWIDTDEVTHWMPIPEFAGGGK